MKKLKILIVSGYFFPDNSPRSFRTTELVKELARQGHEVVAAFPNRKKEHDRFEQEHGVKLVNLGARSERMFDPAGAGRMMGLFKRAMNRALRLFLEYPEITLRGKVKQIVSQREGVDLLISIAAPHPVHWGVAAAFKKGKTGNCWIADCGDPFMGATLDTFKKMFYFKYFESAFCKKANFITVPFEGAKAGYYPEFTNKIKVIPQGFDFNSVKIDPTNYQKHSVPTFAYAGGFIPNGRDPRAFLQHLLSLGVEFKFYIYTRSTALIQDLVHKSKGKIELKPYIPRDALLTELGKMDFIVNVENAITTQLPSKLIDYYLTHRPVLSIPSGQDKAEVLAQFFQADYSGKMKFENMEQYKIENVANAFITLANE